MAPTQATFEEFPTGGTANADRRGETVRQTPLSADAHDAAAIDVPESVGGYERTTTPHAGEIVAWSDGTERVSVIRTIGAGESFEVSVADWSRANPGRYLDEADERPRAIQRAREYMRESTDAK